MKNAIRNLTPTTVVLLILLGTMGMNGKCQTISGTVLDQSTGEGLGFVTLQLQGTTSGAFSDGDGNFSLPTQGDSVHLVVNYLGYHSLDTLIPGQGDHIQLYLQEEGIEMETVHISPSYSYEHQLFKKVLARKKFNNPAKVWDQPYLDQSRTFVFLGGEAGSFDDKRWLRRSQDAVLTPNDSTQLLPVLVSEELVRHKGREQEQLHHQSHCVMEDMEDQIRSIATRKLTAELNFYQNQVDIMGKGFPSPLSSTALLVYDIYLADSNWVEDRWHYRFNFYPKQAKNITFRGSFWVEDSSFALVNIQAELPSEANLNFVQGLEMEVQYRKMPSGTWFYDSQYSAMQLVLRKEKAGKRPVQRYAVRRSIDYHELASYQQAVEAVDSELAPEKRDAALMQALRRTPADTIEQQAHQGIEILRDNTFLKLLDGFTSMSLTGYYTVGIIDLGPYFDIYRQNRLEGHRVTLPFRTSERLSKNFSVGGYLGYGTKSKAFKYGSHLNLRLPTRQRGILTLRAYDDYFSLSQNKFIEFVQENPFSQGDGNFISAFTEAPNPYIVGRKHLSMNLQYQLHRDIGLTVRPFVNQYQATSLVPFNTNPPSPEAPGFIPPGSYQESFQNMGVLADVRLSFDQDADELYFARFYYGSRKPVLHLTAEVGPNLIQGERKPYAHFQASIKNRFSLGNGYLRMLVDAGYIAGKVPFPLLHMPRGSQSLGLARYNYSLLNQASVAADLYTNAYLEFNGGGVLFNRLPGIRRLNLRESASFKSFYGRLLQDHSSIYQLPAGIVPASNAPYCEVGIGVSNIFKLLRVEYVRRMSPSPLMQSLSSKHGVRLRVQVSF